MFSSVRVRLTLWYTAVLTLVLLIFAAATYLIVQKDAIRRTDSAAAEQADSFLKTVQAEVQDESGPEKLQRGIRAAIGEHQFRETIFVVLQQNGQILASSPNQGPRDHLLEMSTQALQDAAVRVSADAGAREFQTVRFGRHAFRSYVQRFTADEKRCTLVVLQSLHSQHEFLETLTTTFALMIPVAILLASIGGYFLARRALSPVAAMGAQAALISAENLHERLAIQNPKDELGQLAERFNDLLNRLDQSFDQQKRFVADASHELRTPVAILCGETEVTLSQPLRSSDEYRESLAILGAEARRLKHIVEDLFTLARADAGQHPLLLADFYLDELAAECVRNMRTLAAARQISLRVDAQSEMPIHADESLLRRMLVNLLDNAIKYTAPGGEVHIRCDQSGSFYQVAVHDNGPGIPHDLHTRIFERFFRVDKARSRSDSSNRDGSGAGLGLSISSWIAASHGGTLNLTTSTPNGSTFTISLPKTAAAS
jgi:two-component system, OmpR family, sensor kinase